MFSIFRKNKKQLDIPGWASFFEAKEFARFMNGVDTYFKQKDITYELGEGSLKIDTVEFPDTVLGLLNVAQLCTQDNPKNYNRIISDHFETFFRANQFEKEFQKIVHDFDKIKKYLGVRLYSNEYISYIGKDLCVGKDFADDVYAMLVFDLPDTIINVLPEQAAKWNKTTDELLEDGIANIKNTYPLEISKQKFNELNIWLVQANHFFVPNVVFDLHKHPEFVGPKGALIGIPHRHSVIIYPIENVEVVKGVTHLIYAIDGMYKEGPGSISSHLFWYSEGRFENLPYKIENGKIQFFPPSHFLELLNSFEE